MTAVRPLRLRLVRPSWAERVCSPAHDALRPADRRAHLATNPDSYLAVTRGLEDVEPGVVVQPDDLLRQGRQALDRLRDLGAFGAERGDEFYVYRLSAHGRTMTGIVGGVRVGDEGVEVHERVKADRALHLARHLDVVGVQSSPIALAHRPDAEITRVIEQAVTTEPLLSFTLDDGLAQTIWAVADAADIEQLSNRFEQQPLYLIDGHHRAAAAATFRAAAGPGMPDWMLSAVFATDELHNAPHHRVIRPSVGIDEALRTIGRHVRLRACELDEIDQRDTDEIALVGNGQWYCLRLPRSGDDTAAGALADLDPSRFQTQVLGPLFRIDPENDDGQLDYVAGRRDLASLAATSRTEGALVAVMRQVPIDVLLAAADAGLIMPPKSTYFEPKVRSGVFLRSTTGIID